MFLQTFQRLKLPALFTCGIPASLCSGIQNQIQMKKKHEKKRPQTIQAYLNGLRALCFRFYCAACIFCVLSAAGFWQYFLDAVYAPIQPAKVPRVRIRRRIQAVL